MDGAQPRLAAQHRRWDAYLGPAALGAGSVKVG
jgi:hypothetical protein